MASVEQIAQSFLGQAAANPQQKHNICRQAAYTFMGLAQDPKNARASKQLSEMGLAFANAATDARPPVMDDFVDLLKETQTAYEQVGPYGDDPMDLVARRREVHDERTPLNPGQVFITPESFNKDATLGRSQKIKYNPTDEEKRNDIQQSQTVAFWQGVKKEAQSLTVDVGFIDPPTVGIESEAVVPLSVRTFGLVQFGSDGNKTEVKFDIGLGTRFTVVGNYVSLNVGADPPLLGSPTAVVTLGASIGVFAAPSAAPIVSTVYIDRLAAFTNSGLIPIPRKAVQLLPVQDSLALGQSVTLQFFGYGGGLNPLFFAVVQKSNTTWPPPIPLTGDIFFVKVFNTTSGINNYRLPFQLSL